MEKPDEEKNKDSLWDNYKYIIIIGLLLIIGYLIYSQFYEPNKPISTYKPTEPFFEPPTPITPTKTNTSLTST